MIKYVELTAPEASAYRQAKILSFERQEGDQVKAGDTLFMVQSGNTKLALPSTKEGRIVEFIVTEHENITLSTPLLLLETEVSSRSATTSSLSEAHGQTDASIAVNTTKNKSLGVKTKNKASKATSDRSLESDAKTNESEGKRLEQQSLDLMAGLADPTIEKDRTSKSKNVNGDGLTQFNPSETTSENESMSDLLTITVPDIGADSAKVIEILVQVGDEVNAEDALVTLESDKASMDVPSPHAGVVKSISVLLDQDVSEGIPLLELESTASANETVETAATSEPKNEVEATEPKAQAANTPETQNTSSSVAVKIPDIGGDSAKVVDVLVAVGDEVAIEDSLITLESDKASMDVPSSASGVIESIHVAIDDDVSEGMVVVTLVSAATSTAALQETTIEKQTETTSPAAMDTPKAAPAPTTSSVSTSGVAANNVASIGKSHASPSIRRFARELGVDLAKVHGSGRKSRITKDDVKAFVKGEMTRPASSTTSNAQGGAGIPAIPAQDFSKFGEIDVQPLNKIKRLTAENLHRSWLNVPHVTHNDESDISDLESFRKQLNAEYKAQNKPVKLSPLAFIVKAVVNALQTYPQFNSSLEPGDENLILKKYFHIGIAVDTPNGLVVPVIRNADQKSVAQIATEMGELAQKARDKKLTMNDMSGACFTISSLGGIGGTSFTPIVNAPEVAILGVSRTKVAPVWNGKEFIPGMMLPLSLSYDHRVIDGAEAARFTRHIAAVLEDVHRLTV